MGEKKRSFKSISCLLKSNFFYAVLILIVSLTFSDTILLPVNHTLAQEGIPLNAITIVEPAEGSLIVSKKPSIKCQFSVPFLRESLYIGVDQTDMTALAKISDNGFTLTPFHVLPPGNHKVTIAFLDENNTIHTGEYKFRTRHSKLFEQAYTTNTLSGSYSQVIGKLDDAKTKQISDWTFEGNLNSESMISDGPWEVSVSTNARYTDQEHKVNDSLEKGFTLVDYTVKGKYDTGELALTASIGDVSVEGTRNTINNLSRKGGTLGMESNHFFLTGFTLRSRQIFGIDDGEDAEPDDSDHLVGITGGGNFLDDKLGFKLIYVSGGEKANSSSYGIWPNSQGTDGTAWGLEVTTDFFDQKLTTLFEYDISDYDAATGDEIGSKSDKAWLVKIGGTVNFFNYDMLYEYTGPDYKVVASSLQQDRKGFTVRSGFSMDQQSIQFNLGKYNDNIDDRPTYARMTTLEYGATYTLDKIAWLPMSLGWQRSTQDSSKEPTGTNKVKNTTNTIFGTISYLKDSWMIGMQPGYARLNDETSVNYDTVSTSITLFSSYTQERFSISPSVALNRFEDCSTGVEQDTLNYNLSFLVNLYQGLNIEGTGSYGSFDSDDNTTNQDSFNADLQLSYQFQEPVFSIISPKVLLRANHNDTKDKVAGASSKETIFYLLLSGSLDLSF